MNSIEERLAKLEQIVPNAQKMAGGITALVKATHEAIERSSADTTRLDSHSRRMDTLESWIKTLQHCTERLLNKIESVEKQLEEEQRKKVSYEDFKHLWKHEYEHQRWVAASEMPTNPAVQPKDPQYVITYGSVDGGFNFVGPFDSKAEANNYLINDRIEDERWTGSGRVVMLQRPAP